MTPLNKTFYSFLENELKSRNPFNLILKGDNLALIQTLAQIQRKPDQMAEAPKEVLSSLKLRGVSIVRGYLGYGRESPQVTEYQLSLLHVAAICNNLAAVSLLMQAGFDPEPTDVRGWTPAHHAAVLGHYDIMTFLQKQAIFDPLNENNGTSRDLYNLVRVPYETMIRVWDHGRRQVFLHPFSDVFKEKEVVAFSDDVHSDPLVLLQEWRNPLSWPENNLPKNLIDQLMSGYTSMKQSPLKVALDLDCRDDQGIPHAKEIGKGLVASDFCSVGDMLCEYGGINLETNWVLHDEQDQHEHRMMQISSAKVRSYFSLAQDSHPNSRQVMVKIGGIHRYILVATELISPGDPITYNYGEHAIKGIKMLHVELRERALTSFWSSEWVQNLISNSAPLLTLSHSWNKESFFSHILYPFDTISAYYQIVLSDFITHFKISQIAYVPNLRFDATYLSAPIFILEETLRNISKSQASLHYKKEILRCIKQYKFEIVLSDLLCNFVGEKRRDGFEALLPEKRVSLKEFYDLVFEKPISKK